MKKLAVIIIAAFGLNATAADDLRQQAERSLQRGVEFLRKEVAVEGTYLWQYSEDLSKREGEGVATATQGWVQPPGTPAVGLAFLAAWRATSNAYYLEAARETAHGLARGQLNSGGWTYSIDFSPAGRRRAAYRDGGDATARNFTTLDDDTTQCALRFLAQTDQALGFRDAKVHECVQYALNAVLKAQFPNGAWPQGFDHAPDPGRYPVKPATYPTPWPREWPGSQNYWLWYTLNDNSLASMTETMLELARIYRAPAAGTNFHALAAACKAAALKAGDFLLLAQMPEPQPGWAQQYNFDMHPVWARKFEPPAVSGGESRGVLRLLLALYRETGQQRFLKPIPRALDYFRRSRLPDGSLARFYELQSNRPLYFTTDYKLTYDDSDVPTHYSFKVADWTAAVAAEYERTRTTPGGVGNTDASESQPKPTAKLIAEVRSVIAAQDARGRWVEGGGLRFHRPKDPSVRVINSATVARNIETLSRYLAATAR